MRPLSVVHRRAYILCIHACMQSIKCINTLLTAHDYHNFYPAGAVRTRSHRSHRSPTYDVTHAVGSVRTETTLHASSCMHIACLMTCKCVLSLCHNRGVRIARARVFSPHGGLVSTSPLANTRRPRATATVSFSMQTFVCVCVYRYVCVWPANAALSGSITARANTPFEYRFRIMCMMICSISFG